LAARPAFQFIDIQNIVQSTSILNCDFSVKIIVIKMEAPSEFTEEQNQDQPTQDQPTYQPRLNEVAQKFLADLDEERKRLSAEFPLCALLIDECKINLALYRVF